MKQLQWQNQDQPIGGEKKKAGLFKILSYVHASQPNTLTPIAPKEPASKRCLGKSFGSIDAPIFMVFHPSHTIIESFGIISRT